MEKIQVIKLYNGDEIIGFIEQFKEEITIKDALQFFLKVDKSGSHSIAMDYWLPVPLIKDNKTTIGKDNIIAIMDPSDDFKEYYENALDSVQKNKEVKDKMDLIEDKSEDKLKLLLEALEVPESRFIN